MHRTDKYSQHWSIIWPVWPNGWVFVYEVSDCGFESRCSHLIFWYGTWFEQAVPWHSGNCRVWIHSQTRTWHDKNTQSNAPYREVLTAQLNHLANLPKWLSVRLRTKWLWVRVPLQSLNLQIWGRLPARVPWHSGNYRVWIHSQTRTWHDKNIQSNAPYREVLTAQLNHLASLAKWLIVCLRTKWLWVRVPLQSLNLQIWRLFRARSS